MHLFNHHFLRIFVALLVTVFVANTVYAGGMMVSTAITQAQQTHVQQHAHSTQHADLTHQHAHIGLSKHTLDHKPASHGGCKHCNHCLACSSMMPSQLSNFTQGTHQVVLAITLTPLYLSPTSPQLQKPPIA
jgi:hypothetical protein